MEFDPAHVVGTGGAVGALLRQYVDHLVDVDEFPLGTLTVNVLGTFLLGFVTFLGVDSTTLLLLGTGVCGSFTTFSSFSVQTVRLWETGDRLRAVGNATLNLLGAGLALAVAWGLVRIVG
ncbi:chromosome condensation protein CrcB [Haloprofundus marisrubri]|uniref:Fluoride-specific ion channel FluC n=2 Tax=Haloprofundus marisrubri TaxID=1514971 RepID=A0A0W1RD83_9EURY|nr:fluoride efflux transporter CrcB [Haloprofundus marisrubri]KTG11530.1 chromosome condensation protein CrcB [Haloprofundus marisrubri]